MYLAPDLQWFGLALIAYSCTIFVIAPINAYVAAARGAQSLQRALTMVPAGFSAGMIFSPSLGGWIGEQWGLRSVYAISAVAFAFSTLAMLMLREQPVVPSEGGASRYGGLFRNRRFLGFMLLVFVSVSALYLGYPFAPNFVSEVRGLELSKIGWLGSLNSAGAMTLSLVFGHRIPRRGFVLAQGLYALSLVLLLWTSGLGWLSAAFFLRSAWSLAIYMTRAQVGRVVSPAEIGLAFGITETVVQSAVIAAPILAGVLYRQAPPLPFQVSLGLVLATIPLFWWLAPRRDEPAEPALPAEARLTSQD
jgi:predicted MFS family arabinose efflux permease